MGDTKVPGVLLQGNDDTIAGRSLIQPCAKRCQMMSPSHILWGGAGPFSNI